MTSLETTDRLHTRAPSRDLPINRVAQLPVELLRIVFVGPPGSGKGTQAALLAERHGYAHISTGELLRTIGMEETAESERVRVLMAAGELIPDAFVLDLVLAEIGRCAAEGRGYILDGFPRTLAQYRILGRGAAEDPVDLAITFRVSAEHLEQRLAERGRADDAPATISRRLESYRRDTVPMIRAMRATSRVVTVDGEGSVEQVQRALDGILRGL